MALPPLLAGAVNGTLMAPNVDTVAVPIVGASGTVIVVTGFDVALLGLLPSMLVAYTTNV
jgi:hypothetical protein